MPPTDWLELQAEPDALTIDTYTRESPAPVPEFTRKLLLQGRASALDMAWQDDARCSGLMQTSPDLFFPEAWDTNGIAAAAAAAVCAHCQVTQPCLEYALKMGITDGVWGGLGPDERKAHKLPGWRTCNNCERRFELTPERSGPSCSETCRAELRTRQAHRLNARKKRDRDKARR